MRKTVKIKQDLTPAEREEIRQKAEASWRSWTGGNKKIVRKTIRTKNN